MESKEFQVLIKGGYSGVRFFERSKGKTRSIFLQRDELVWLAGTVQEVVAEESSKVFWDQSRAGYPRIIAQKCSNCHGRFLTLEEFDGRRRCGTILIPEGRYGQGWERFVLEVRLARESISEASKVGGVKKGGAVRGRGSYAETLGMSDIPGEECCNSYTEPFARLPTWLKEASDDLGLKAQGSEMTMKGNCAPAKFVGALGGSKAQSFFRLACGLGESRDCADLVGVVAGEVPASKTQLPVDNCAGKTAMDIGYGQLIGLEGRDFHEGLPVINVKQELSLCRESLRVLKIEVDSGLARLDRVIKNLGDNGMGQGSNSRMLVSPTTNEAWVKPKNKLLAKHNIKVGLGDGSKMGPRERIKPIESMGRERKSFRKELGRVDTTSSVG